jgi:hypothetical protein
MIREIIDWFQFLHNDPVFYDSNGDLHRPNGPAAWRRDDWTWRFHGERHRYYGPSDLYNGKLYWYHNGRWLKND